MKRRLETKEFDRTVLDIIELEGYIYICCCNNNKKKVYLRLTVIRHIEKREIPQIKFDEGFSDKYALYYIIISKTLLLLSKTLEDLLFFLFLLLFIVSDEKALGSQSSRADKNRKEEH